MKWAGTNTQLGRYASQKPERQWPGTQRLPGGTSRQKPLTRTNSAGYYGLARTITADQLGQTPNDLNWLANHAQVELLSDSYQTALRTAESVLHTGF